MSAVPRTSPGADPLKRLAMPPKRPYLRQRAPGWTVALVLGIAVGSCRSTCREKTMDLDRYLVAGPYPTGINPEQSSAGLIVLYTFAFCQCADNAAAGYGLAWRRFDYFPSGSDVLQPSLDAQELGTLRWVPDLESLGECIKSEVEDGYSVYTLPPAQLFAPDTPHPPVRALTREEIEGVRRLVAE